MNKPIHLYLRLQLGAVMETVTSDGTSGGGDIRIVSTHGNVNGGSLEIDVSADVEPPTFQASSAFHKPKSDREMLSGVNLSHFAHAFKFKRLFQVQPPQSTMHRSSSAQQQQLQLQQQQRPRQILPMPSAASPTIIMSSPGDQVSQFTLTVTRMRLSTIDRKGMRKYLE